MAFPLNCRYPAAIIGELHKAGFDIVREKSVQSNQRILIVMDRSELKAEVVQRKDDPNAWGVEAIDPNEGSVELIIFSGPAAEYRAKEYATSKYSSRGNRKCCHLENNETPCGADAEWEMWPSTAVYESVDSCTKHVGYLLDDAPETRIVFIGQRQ